MSCDRDTWTDDSAEIIFRDGKFLEAILENPGNSVDIDRDGRITQKEARTATYLDVSLSGIGSMEELAYFTSLTELRCYGQPSDVA